MTDTSGIRLFVYGTLKSNQCNGEFMESCGEFIGFDSVTGPYKMIDYDVFPVVLPDEGKSRTIFGEVYKIHNEEALAAIDLYEGHPHYFKRKKVTTDMKQLKVWMYTFEAEGMDEEDTEYIHEGPWLPSETEQAFWEITF